MRNFFINLTDRSSRSLLLVSVPLYLALFIFFDGLGIKFDVSQWFFSISGHAWALKHNLITESVLHDGFRALNIVIVAGILIFYLSQSFKPLRVTSLVRLSQFIGALLLSFIVVNLMKGVTGMHCPWDLNMFGGRFDYQPLWLAASQPEPGRCFPAGHASIGYAWFSLFFYLRKDFPVIARKALIGSLLIGLLLGFAQQLRGAHFISDDITTAFICWVISALIFIGDKPNENR